MDAPVMFRDLPATFPEKDQYKKRSILSSVIFHGALILMVIVIPLLMPQSISERELLITLVSPLGPPPAPAPPPPPVEVVAAAPPKIEKQIQVPADTLVMPTAIPKEIAHIVEDPIAPSSGVIGGVPGGVARGVVGGILGGVLASNTPAAAPPPPPPPPPKVVPTEPVRVGGMVQEPRLLKLVPPVYPVLASKARISGTVILEATLTVDGTVDQIKVVSGHPLLIEAAIDCVKQWRYEPTLLNGIPVAVILTAKVHFNQRIISQ